MEWSNFALFFAASWMLIITPGPDMIYAITKGISQGRKAGMISAVGVALGILVYTIFASCGLAIFLRSSALAFLAAFFDKQTLPGTFEYCLNYLVDNKIDLTGFDDRHNY